MATNCLWNDIDDDLKARVEAALGAEGAYGDLVVQAVKVTNLWEPETWGEAEFPVVVIGSSYRGQIVGGPHGDGEVKNQHTYPYTLSSVSLCDSEAAAKRQAAELGRRIVILLQSCYGLGNLRALDGETVQKTDISALELYVFPHRANRSRWFGAASVQLDVLAETE